MEKNYTKDYKSENRFTNFEGGSETTARELPFRVKFAVFWGGVPMVIGFVFTLLGLIALLGFGSAVSLDDMRFSNSDPTAQGKILDEIGTDSYVNDVRVYEYRFEFQATDGKAYKSTCYHTGRAKIPDGIVQVQYFRSNPQKARIVGMKISVFPFFIIFVVAIFPLIGGLMLFFGIRKALKRLRILKFGKTALGTFSHQEETNVTINKQRVYRMYFTFTDSSGTEHTTFDQTHLTHRLRDEVQEWLVYNPAKPDEAVLLDTLPPVVKRFFEK